MIQFLKAVKIIHTKQSRNSPNKNVEDLQYGIGTRQTYKSMEQISKRNPHTYSRLIFHKGAKRTQGGGGSTVFSPNGGGAGRGAWVAQ